MRFLFLHTHFTQGSYLDKVMVGRTFIDGVSPVNFPAISENQQGE